jgi:O-antigen/teichoic acid export membrane protein
MLRRSYVATGTLWLLAALAFQHGMGFANAWVALRVVDVDTYGALVFVVSWLAIPVALVSQGLPQAATHWLAFQRVRGNPDEARAALVQIRWLVTLAGVALALAMPAAADLFPASIASAFDARVLGALLAALVLLQALVDVLGQAALGLRNPRLSALASSFVPHALRFAAILLVLPLVPDAQGLVLCHLLALVGALLVAELLVARAGLPAGAPRFDRARALWRFGLPLVGAEALAVVLFHGDKILLGYFGDPAQVGTYGVASRLAFLVVAPHWASGRVFAPVFAELWSAGRSEELRRVYQRNTELSLVVTGLGGALAVTNARWVLGLFGPEFAAPELVSATRILVAGLCATVLAGHQGQLYRMTAKTLVPTLNTALAAVVCVALNAVLIPRFGVRGAALATALAFVALNLSGVLLLRRFFDRGVHPFGPRYLACACAAALLFAVAFAWREHVVAGNLTVGALGAGALALVLRRATPRLGRAAAPEGA